MILEQKQAHIAYHCPYCGNAVLGFVGAFALSGDMLKIKCTCGHSELSVTCTKDNKVRLTVPCLFCENPHHFVVSQTVFFGRDVFLLNCPYAGMDVCFIGKPEHLQKELDRSAKELNALYEEMGAVLPIAEESEREEITPPQLSEEELLPDEEVYDIVRFLVRELQADAAIDCPCHSGDYDFEMIAGGVRVYCRECGADYLFPANTVSAAQEFLGCDEVKLTADPKTLP
ncbi:MAG: hypothetical protein J6K61_00040 [Clostridia bacterium]|nr:hypothetical protein [Clostridia bacterium]